jgi:hypothetical protein
MPNLIKQIPETMHKQGIPAETLARFDFPEDGGAEEVMALINQMDKLLTKKQRLSIMEEQGCCKTGKAPAAHRGFGNANKGKTLKEKISLLNETKMPHNVPCCLNDDNTLSVFWEIGEEGSYGCVCGIIKKLPKPVEVPRTFCGCCGGHIRHSYQQSLGVKLRLKDIVSSAASSKGKNRCEFLFEIE